MLGTKFPRLLVCQKKGCEDTCPKATTRKLRVKLKVLFRKGRGRNLSRFIQETLNPVLRGWISYFALADVKSFAIEMDQWIRKRLRLILWRQWKRRWTRRNRLMQHGLSEIKAVMTAFNGRGPWYTVGTMHVSFALSKRYFAAQGLISLLDELHRIRDVRSRNRRGT